VSSYHYWTHAPKEDGGTDPLPGDAIRADRAIEYLWGGPKWNWYTDPPGDPLCDDFDNWTRDTSIDFGGYLHNDPGAADGDEMFIGAPLGPRWSCWNLDICYGRGPDHGIIDAQVVTVPFYRTCGGVGVLSPPPSAGARFDIPNASDSGFSSAYDDWDWFDFNAGVDGYNSTETFNSYHSEMGRTFRITGKYGKLLTNPDTGLCEPLTGDSFDSGDGLIYYFRLFVNGKNASSSGFKFRIQAVRLSRAIENDSTLI
jgi:hypothetical protein